MSQTNKQLALDHVSRINAGDFAGAAALLAEDCVNHAAIPEAQGRKGFERIISKVRTAFPDMHYNVEDVLTDGDRVVLRSTCTGTQTGPLTFLRFEGPPSNKPVRFEQIHILRVAGGKIVEMWMEQDTLALLRQLDVKVAPHA
jgi:predicted ester cyclase